MNVNISVGAYVAAEKPAAGNLGFWVGKVIGAGPTKGFYTAKVLLSNGAKGDLSPVSFCNGRDAKHRTVVGFRTLKQAAHYSKKRRRSLRFISQFVFPLE